MRHHNKSNKLINESSPYLQQHAHNPVDWYPWGSEALARARDENKPILLSIGYAACHWCHVMAHESFEDNETAELMNRLFINIKVDREERPDLDKVYQSTHYLLTQRGGGWPLTVFLTPNDLTPFFSGTYFPLQAKYQLPAFKDVLQSLSDIYHHRQNDIQQQNAELARILNPQPPVISDVRLNEQPIQHALQLLQRSYDTQYGGFGSAPKFPQPSRLGFLLDHASPMAPATLLHMAGGGIYDQLGGGFYRYSVDAQWRIPHFEKMLSDNGQLLYLYSQAYKLYPEPIFADITRQTAKWVMTVMQSPQDGYFSSMNADSEGHEGKYYVWDTSEVKSLLTSEEFSVIEIYFGLNQHRNFENAWHFYLAQPQDFISAHLKIPLSQVNDLLFSAKHKLLTARTKRIAPTLDTKILTAWNGLMIKGMMTAGFVLNEPEWIDSANLALTYIKNHHWVNHRLLATSQSRHATLMGYLDDYAFLLDALLTSLQLSWKKEHLDFAIELADTLLTHFTDSAAGGFYFTAEDHERLLYRPKSFMDEALPAGNAVAARCLLILGQLLGEPRYTNAAEKTLHAGWPMLTQHPAEHCELLKALNDYLQPPQMIILRGESTELKSWLPECLSTNNYVFAIPKNEKELPGLLALKKTRSKTCAYVCQGTQCLDVIEDLHTLHKVVGESYLK